MNKKTLGILLFLAAIAVSGGILAHNLVFKFSSAKQHTLTIMSEPGDLIDLYEYADYNLPHQGKEIFYTRKVNENGELSVVLSVGKYTLFARCIEMNCQRSFDGPSIITLDRDKTVRLKWHQEF